MDYSAITQKAAILIAANGAPWTLSRAGSTLGIIKGIRTSATKSLNNIPLSIQAAAEFVFAAGGLEPKPGDSLTNGATTYTIQEVQAIAPSTTVLVYKVKA